MIVDSKFTEIRALYVTFEKSYLFWVKCPYLSFYEYYMRLSNVTKKNPLPQIKTRGAYQDL